MPPPICLLYQDILISWFVKELINVYCHDFLNVSLSQKTYVAIVMSNV